MFISCVRPFQRNSNVLGTVTTLGESSKQNMLLWVRLWETRPKIPTNCILCLKHPLWMWQMLQWQTRQNVSSAAMRIYTQSQRSSIKIYTGPIWYAYEKGYQTSWNEARILQIETNSTFQKHKVLIHIACLTNLIGQSSLEISPMRILNY